MIRTFIALPLPEAVKDTLQQAIVALKGRIDARWVRPEAMHLTLKFLGDIEEDLVPELAAGLDRLCAGTPPLHFTLAGLGAFPGTRRARVIWAGLEGDTAEVITLAAEVDRLCVRFGLPAEARPFRPHITLGRLKTPTMVELVTALPRTAFGIDEGRFYRSELLREGARHTVLHAGRLGG